MTLPENVNYILDTLVSHGYSAYLVGGCVRDMLMKKAPHDYDITTNAMPDETEALFSDHTLILSGKKHGTVAVCVSGEVIEITTYRIDGTYADNRHPMQVSFTDRIEEDLARRDFTMNAIAMSKDGMLTDPFGGGRDIERGIIRCVGTPTERFGEDALRIMRAVRFSSVTGFSIEDSTGAAVHSCRELLRNISAERILSELIKTLNGKNAGVVMKQYRDVFSVVLPCCEDIEKVGMLPVDTAIRLAYMLKAASDPLDALGYLRVSNALRDEVLSILANYGDVPADMPHLRLFVGKYGADIAKKCCILAQLCHATDMSGTLHNINEITENKLPCRISDLAINGDDLKKLGMRGKEIGDRLNDLLLLVVSGKAENSRSALSELLR